MADEQRAAQPEALTHERHRYLFLVKELFWIATCIALESYPLLAAAAVFASYPYWRRPLRAWLAHERAIDAVPVNRE